MALHRAPPLSNPLTPNPPIPPDLHLLFSALCSRAPRRPTSHRVPHCDGTPMRAGLLHCTDCDRSVGATVLRRCAVRASGVCAGTTRRRSLAPSYPHPHRLTLFMMYQRGAIRDEKFCNSPESLPRTLLKREGRSGLLCVILPNSVRILYELYLS